jgi:protein-S-isoprenylcysteine O-methyltransferase Ste14
MDELSFHSTVIWVVLVLALLTALAVSFIPAPYGRHIRPGWGPTCRRRIGWIVMEMPAVALFAVVFFMGSRRAQLVPLLLFVLWQIHYVHRTLIFPFRIPDTGKRMPIMVVALAFLFQSTNSYVNGRWLTEFGLYTTEWLIDPRFIIGVAVFLIGFGINLHADTLLLNLRKPGETGYKIPHGGAFRYVSCPNYMGEILEWIGWAIATWSMAGLAFAVYTAANIGPRAFTNHQWYKDKFPDYPKERRALIPFIW